MTNYEICDILMDGNNERTCGLFEAFEAFEGDFDAFRVLCYKVVILGELAKIEKGEESCLPTIIDPSKDAVTENDLRGLVDSICDLGYELSKLNLVSEEMIESDVVYPSLDEIRDLFLTNKFADLIKINDACDWSEEKWLLRAYKANRVGLGLITLLEEYFMPLADLRENEEIERVEEIVRIVKGATLNEYAKLIEKSDFIPCLVSEYEYKDKDERGKLEYRNKMLEIIGEYLK